MYGQPGVLSSTKVHRRRQIQILSSDFSELIIQETLKLITRIGDAKSKY